MTPPDGHAVTGLPFWTWQLVVALAVNVVVQAIQIGAYAARLAGVRTGRIATSISLFNLFVTASRLATLVYTLMLGPLSDTAGNAIKALLPGRSARSIAAASPGDCRHCHHVRVAAARDYPGGNAGHHSR